jgi:pantoate--beta-alanine ligase
VRIIVAPTIRERDGLAMSSRNKYLSSDERAQAAVLWQAIQEARAAVKTRLMPARSLQQQLRVLIEAQPSARIDYIAFFDAQTLEPATTVKRGTHLALAVFMGKTRLIDNAMLQ